MATKTKTDPRVTKRRVTMKSVEVSLTPEGMEVRREFTAVDHVRPDHLDEYVRDAREKWQVVTVSEEPDAGPAGYEGATHVPEHLNLPDAGTTYPAQKKRG